MAVAVIRDGHLLLGRRIAAHGNGRLQLPGGKPQAGESHAATAVRELREETGLCARDAREVAIQVDDFPEVGKRYTTHFFVALAAAGEPRNLEPAKCEGWSWFALDALPADLFRIDPATLAAIARAAG
ncbi:MAG: NUDIX domain-containing protein [Candidatus Velthaea sp.]